MQVTAAEAESLRGLSEIAAESLEAALEISLLEFGGGGPPAHPGIGDEPGGESSRKRVRMSSSERVAFSRRSQCWVMFVSSRTFPGQE